jgi:superfamily I DNA/RNA helicase
MSLVRPEDWRPQGVHDLEPRAWEALREVNRSVLVTAGAGAGKTEFLAQKATYLLQTGLCPAPRRILAISFKRDAARNLTTRVQKRCPPEHARRFNSFTFDGFAKSLLDRFRAAIPAPLSPPAGYRIIFPRRQDFSDFLDRNRFHALGPDQLERAVARTPLPVDESDGSIRSRAVAEYWRTHYAEAGDVQLSFAMINRLVDLLLRENAQIRRALHLTYPAVFLDEFQDTTFAQFELLHTAFDGSAAVFTAVGDDKQRIMVWAGAMPDAFNQFRCDFRARRINLVSNWRSHEDLVRIQHVIASRIDPDAELPEARAAREVDGEVAAIWEFANAEQESGCLAEWIDNEIRSGNVEPHEIAILVRMHADQVERQLESSFSEFGIRLRNEARNVGDISIQDLLGEELTAICLPLLRLGATDRSPEHWNAALANMQFLEAADPQDELRQQQLQRRLSDFVRELRRTMRSLEPGSASAIELSRSVLEFVDARLIRQSCPAYQRQRDFDRAWEGFTILLSECAERVITWQDTLDEFEGLGQVALMTIHKSKGLEFHTMIFYGLDNRTWWSLTPDRQEELNSFFVAFTRAKQRAFFTLCTERGQPVTWIEDLLAPAGVRRIKGARLLEPR